MRFPKLPRGIVVLAAVLVLAAPSRAQFGELGGFAESMHPEYLSRDLVVFAESLELDKSQKDVLESLYSDYKTAFESGLETMQARLSDLKKDLVPGDRERILQLIFVPFEEWAIERRKLGDQFILSIELILNDQQKEHLPAFRRRLVREKTLQKGMLSGESLDLTLIVKQLDLTSQEIAAAKAVVEEYEVALHQALEHRNRLILEGQPKIIQALQEDDPDRNLDLIESQIEARVDVREVNDTYIVLIGDALPGQHRDEFLERSLSRAYNKAYRPSPVERMFEAVLELDLDPGVQASIASLQELYLAELDMYRMALVEVIREYEPERERNRVTMFAARMKGEKPVQIPDPTVAEVRKRERLDDQYTAMLQSLLSTEDFAALPGAEQWLSKQANKDRVEKRERAQAGPKARPAHPGKEALRGSKPGGGLGSGAGPGSGTPKVGG